MERPASEGGLYKGWQEKPHCSETERMTRMECMEWAAQAPPLGQAAAGTIESNRTGRSGGDTGNGMAR